MRRLLLSLRSLDWILLAVVGLLVAFSLVILYSLTLNIERPDTTTFYQQLIFAGIGFAALFALSAVDPHTLRGSGWILFGAGALLLLAVVLFGTEIRGAKSWLVLGGVTLQPVEFAKLFLIIFFAKYVSDRAEDLFSLRHVLIAGAAALLYVGLVLVQPDLGSSLILIGIFAATMIMVNVRRSHLLLLLAVFVVGAILSWFVLFRPYQRERITALFHPSSDPQRIGYNVQQSTIAIGSGGLFGRGLGLGSQSRLNFLPEQKSDFIFAVVAEELGFVGAAVLLGLYSLLFYRLFRIARRCREEFSVSVLFGIFIMLFIQMVMNIGMNLGLMPVVGVPLPFLSAGGSSLISMLAAIGIAQGIARHQPQRGFADR